MAVARNDFFQWGHMDRLAVGGAPHYALSLDGDLLTGELEFNACLLTSCKA